MINVTDFIVFLQINFLRNKDNNFKININDYENKNSNNERWQYISDQMFKYVSCTTV